MTFQDFITKYSGKKIDFDNAFQGQCVDLYRQYVKEVLNLPQSPGVVGASEIFETVSTNLYEKIKNTPDGVPKNGDIVIWNKKAGGGFGHVAVFVSGSLEAFKSFDQNWRAINVCEITSHDYKNVTGWLRAKKPIPVTTEGKTYSEEEFTKVRLERDENWTLYRTEIELHSKDLTDIAVGIGSTNTVPGILARVKSLTDVEERLREAQKAAEKQQEQFNEERAELLRRIETLTDKVENILLQLKDLKEQTKTVEEKEEIVEIVSPKPAKRPSMWSIIISWLKG